MSAARHTTIHMTPDTDAFKGGEITVMEKLKKRQNTAETPESIASSGMETDSTFTFDDDVEDTSAPSYLRSLPSPEIFRKENYGVSAFLSIHNPNEGLLGSYVFSFVML